MPVDEERIHKIVDAIEEVLKRLEDMKPLPLSTLDVKNAERLHLSYLLAALVEADRQLIREMIDKSNQERSERNAKKRRAFLEEEEEDSGEADEQ